jgi:hypothetical protein
MATARPIPPPPLVRDAHDTVPAGAWCTPAILSDSVMQSISINAAGMPSTIDVVSGLCSLKYSTPVPQTKSLQKMPGDRAVQSNKLPIV